MLFQNYQSLHGICVNCINISLRQYTEEKFINYLHTARLEILSFLMFQKVHGQTTVMSNTTSQ